MASPGESRLRIGLDALDHRGEAVGALLGEVARQPDVCGVAGYLGGKLEGKLLYSASLLWGWAWDGSAGKPQPSGPYAEITVDGDRPAAATDEPRGQSTLGLDDLVAPWRGPAKEG